MRAPAIAQGRFGSGARWRGDAIFGISEERHGRCERLAEAGCTLHEINAMITGHRIGAGVRPYTAKADQVRLAHSAFEKLQGTAHNPKPANPL